MGCNIYMNLTHDDLQAIREIIKTELPITVRGAIKEELRPISGELEALRNDVLAAAKQAGISLPR